MESKASPNDACRKILLLNKHTNIPQSMHPVHFEILIEISLFLGVKM